MGINPLYLLILVNLIGCFSESPRDRRSTRGRHGPGEGQSFYDWFAKNNPNTNREDSSGDNVTVDDSDDTDGDNRNDNDNDNGQSTDNIQIPEKINHCSWSQDGINNFAGADNHLGGAYTVCKSKEGEKSEQRNGKNARLLDIFFQAAHTNSSSSTDSDSQLCFIPTTIKGNIITYAGNAQCLNIVSSKQIYQITLVSERFNNASINGVVILKDKMFLYPAPYNQNILGPDAYFYCKTWLEQTGSNNFCNAFQNFKKFVYKQF